MFVSFLGCPALRILETGSDIRKKMQDAEEAINSTYTNGLVSGFDKACPGLATLEMRKARSCVSARLSGSLPQVVGCELCHRQDAVTALAKLFNF